MALESTNIENLLSVGAVVMFHVDVSRKDSPRYKTTIRGWRAGTNLMLDRPRAPNTAYVALVEGQVCVLRYVHGGKACAFDSMVLDWDSRRLNAYLRVAWPKEVKWVTFRKFERIALGTACVITSEDGPRSGHIDDLSIGGCGLQSEHRYKEESDIDVSFELPDGTSVRNVKALVRSVRRSGGGFAFGAQFKSGQESVANDIAFYVTTTLARMRGEPDEEAVANYVLVLDNDPEVTRRLRHNFSRQGFEAVCAANAVDGFARLHRSPPAALLCSQDLPDLPGILACDVVRKNERFAKLPIFVYGGEGDGLAEGAKSVGATDFFPKSPSIAPDVAFDVSQFLKKRDEA